MFIHFKIDQIVDKLLTKATRTFCKSVLAFPDSSPTLITVRKRSLRRLCFFTPVCQSFCSQGCVRSRGECVVVVGGGCGRGHACWGGCGREACMAGGHTWGGVAGGHAW